MAGHMDRISRHLTCGTRAGSPVIIRTGWHLGTGKNNFGVFRFPPGLPRSESQLASYRRGRKSPPPLSFPLASRVGRRVGEQRSCGSRSVVAPLGQAQRKRAGGRQFSEHQIPKLFFPRSLVRARRHVPIQNAATGCLFRVGRRASKDPTGTPLARPILQDSRNVQVRCQEKRCGLLRIHCCGMICALCNMSMPNAARSPRSSFGSASDRTN